MRRAPQRSRALPASVEVLAKTIIVVEKMNAVSACDHPNSPMSATKKTANESRIPKTTASVRQQTPTITHP